MSWYQMIRIKESSLKSKVYMATCTDWMGGRDYKLTFEIRYDPALPDQEHLLCYINTRDNGPCPEDGPFKVMIKGLKKDGYKRDISAGRMELEAKVEKVPNFDGNVVSWHASKDMLQLLKKSYNMSVHVRNESGDVWDHLYSTEWIGKNTGMQKRLNRILLRKKFCRAWGFLLGRRK